MATPTHDDAQLMIQIAQWGTSMGLDTAMSRVFDDSFDPEPAEARDEGVRTLGEPRLHENFEALAETA